MSISGVLRESCFASLICAALPGFGRAQSVVVRHSAVAEIAPVVGIRDSAWSGAREIDGGTHTTWSGEIRANTAAELQVMVPRRLPGTAYARAHDGPWLPLEPGAWKTIVLTAPGRNRVTVVVTALPADDPVKPAVRVVAR